jgi:putative oxidoreductase
MTTMTVRHDSAIRRWFVWARSFLERVPLSVILLAMRIAVGSVFLKAGLLKYGSWEFTVKLFEDEYKVPVLTPAGAARIAMFNELTWPIFLFLGLATRVATLPLLSMLVVIQLFVYPQAWTDNLLWGSILILLLTRGAGALSVDAWIERRLLRTPHRSTVE